jgi:hypothetical protein
MRIGEATTLICGSTHRGHGRATDVLAALDLTYRHGIHALHEPRNDKCQGKQHGSALHPHCALRWVGVRSLCAQTCELKSAAHRDGDGGADENQPLASSAGGEKEEGRREVHS